MKSNSKQPFFYQYLIYPKLMYLPKRIISIPRYKASLNEFHNKQVTTHTSIFMSE